MSAPRPDSGFSLRGLFIGVLLCVGVGLVAPYWAVFTYNGVGFAPASPGAILFLMVTVLASAAVGLISRRLSLSKADLVLIFCMLLVAITVPTWGTMFFLIGTMVYPFYFATPENRFADLLHPYIPSWIVPQDVQAIKDYYEGLPRGAPIPWEAWVEPMGHWLALTTVMGFMLICMSAILHRQWSVHERLTYPMMQLPQQMIDGSGGIGSRLAPFFRSKAMWLGFAVPVITLSLSGLNHFWPEVPEFSQVGGLRLFNNTVHLGFYFKPAYLGFFYLVDLNILFSIWFFYLLCKFQDGVFKILGFANTEKLSVYEYSQSADLTHQMTGAVIVFVLYGMWIARGHILAVARKAWNPSEGMGDSEELLKYRTAVIGFLASLVFCGVWLWRSGVPAVTLPVLLIVSLIFFTLVARVVTTAGVATARSPIVPAFFIISGLGTSILGAKGLVALNFTFIWQGESQLSAMVATSNGLKLAERIPGPKGLLFWGLMLALVVTFLASAWMTLKLGYTYGAINLNLLNWVGAHGWPSLGAKIADMPDANMRGWLFRGIGAAVEGFLMFAQHRWHWWSLHPIGFTIAVGWLTSKIWFPALIAWVIKLTILFFWGPRMFQVMKPFFLGLIMGEIAVGGIWGTIFPFTSETGRWLTFI